MIALITGATGFIGRPLASRLTAEGYGLRILTRNPHVSQGSGSIRRGHPIPPGAEIFAWPSGSPVPDEALAGVDAVVHLAGENIGAWPWTRERKRRILESRVHGTRALVAAMGRQRRVPRVFVAASAIGYYGDSGSAPRVETDAPGAGFLAEVTRAWEAEIFAAGKFGIRTVAVRNGLVLGRGGALGKMLPAYRSGLGAVLGSGEQYWSWIHLQDTLGIFMHALADAEMQGACNGVAPHPATQRDFSRTLALTLHRPMLLKIPAFVLRLGLGELADTLLGGQRAESGKIESLGYHFRYPTLPPALADLIAHRTSVETEPRT